MDIVLPPDFKEFLKLLNAHNIKYLLIGGTELKPASISIIGV